MDKKTAPMRVLLNFALLIGSAVSFNGEIDGENCPKKCNCHYFRTNWVVDCSERNMTTVPVDELSRNVNVEVYVLDMNGNNVAEVTPFPEGMHLRRLQMAHNLITSLNRSSFAGLAYLLDADFSFNRIADVDPESFSDSPGLITLELQNNPLKRVEGIFLNCRSLLYLDLSGCGIESLSEEFFFNTSALNRLDLSSNPLVEIEPGPFDHLENLEYLRFNNCQLKSVSPEAFASLRNLREIDLANNDLKMLDWKGVLSPLIRLERLNVRNSSVTNLPGDAFSENLYLRHLELADNELRHLDVGNTLGHNLHNLMSLDLSNCMLKDRLTEEAFVNASKLRVLHLDGNPLLASDLTAVLHHLPKLQIISLSNCELRRLPEAFQDLDNLQVLKISHNPLNDAFVGLLKPPKSLEYLDMSYCKLGHVGNDTFSKMTMLKRLILSGNELRKLERGIFANLTRLETLELERCDLEGPLNPEVFGDRRPYVNIRELKLGGNPLVVPKDLPVLPEQLAGLSILDLSDCEISSFSLNSFDNTPNLTNLNIRGNKIHSADGLSFLGRLRFLESLDIGDNALTSIRPSLFDGNPKLRYLNLIGNPFKCDCYIVDMWAWAERDEGDKHLLAGGRSAEFVAGSAKIKKSLTCAYGEKDYQKIISRNSSALDENLSSDNDDSTTKRTWAKYVDESNCPTK
ncbi:leucine-rich repeat-containing G-protein coupled receptor 6-like isoform X2 [Athalia rosae]|nr:leucine-rich repeat-containing G-protein coupled receptor 6-like isoform X2 [Athalia rosae]